ncbi:MAG: efflux RND transporter periplasmic adaptor subunit [Deltaproteobacteria bacterium]|nr:efflux RND transporter periplasmic adaptor subunit [Deltaproteobacteria bacterium]
MRKRSIVLAILGLIILIGVLAGVKVLQIRKMIEQGKEYVPPPETVTVAPVVSESWGTALTAVGSLTAVQGVTVAAELTGKVMEIDFTPGAKVKAGELLVRQDTSSEEARLPGLEARTVLARKELERARRMLAEKIISQSDFDSAVAAYDQARAEADNVRVTIAKKHLRAPFSGRLGIRQVNLGQILKEGEPVVTLQTLDPVFVDFSLPQQQLSQLRTGLKIRVTCDALPGSEVEGKITAINPLVDVETRNIRIQATVANKSEKLRPGMFVNVNVDLPQQEKVLVIPATAVLYAPFGDSVFVVVEGPKKAGSKVVSQQFVRLGKKRGDLVAVTSGLKAGDIVVSTGVFKLRNGQAVVVDNRLAPEFSAEPKPENR